MSIGATPVDGNERRRDDGERPEAVVSAHQLDAPDHRRGCAVRPIGARTARNSVARCWRSLAAHGSVSSAWIQFEDWADTGEEYEAFALAEGEVDRPADPVSTLPAPCGPSERPAGRGCSPSSRRVRCWSSWSCTSCRTSSSATSRHFRRVGRDHVRPTCRTAPCSGSSRRSRSCSSCWRSSPSGRGRLPRLFAAVTVSLELGVPRTVAPSVARSCDRDLTWIWSATVLPVAALAYFRLDFLAVLFATLALIGIERRRATVWPIVAGVATKLWPGLLLVVLAAERRWREVVAGVCRLRRARRRLVRVLAVGLPGVPALPGRRRSGDRERPGVAAPPRPPRPVRGPLGRLGDRRRRLPMGRPGDGRRPRRCSRSSSAAGPTDARHSTRRARRCARAGLDAVLAAPVRAVPRVARRRLSPCCGSGATGRSAG